MRGKKKSDIVETDFIGTHKYLKNRTKRKNLTSGIIANANFKNFSGRWMCYKKQSSDLNQDDFSNWELLGI